MKSKSNEFMDRFMKKLENGQYKKDNLPQIDEGFIPDDVSIQDCVFDYGVIIQTNIFNQVTANKSLIKSKIN